MKKGGLRAYIIWVIGSLFYLYEYYVRVVPSVIETELETNFSATATEVAAAVGMYLMAYSPMQLVVGPLFDTCGSRKLFLPASLILTFSCLLPLLPTETLFCFGLGRFLMGFSSAFGFVGVMYLCTIWFPKRRLAMLSGLTTALGLIGAIAAQSSLSWINTACGWKNIWWFSFGFGIFVTFLLLIFIPNNPDWVPKPRGKHIWIQCKNNLLCVAKKKYSWTLGLLAGALFMPLAVFADFWSIPYFTKVYNFTNNQAVQLTAILYLSWAIGAPILGWISDAFKVRKMPLIISGLATTLLFLWLLILENASFWEVACLLSLLGIASSGQVISFITCAELNPPQANASSIAVVNMIIMWFCGFVQSISGWIIDYFTPVYSLKTAYQLSLMLITLLLLVTTLLFWITFPKKKKHEALKKLVS